MITKIQSSDFKSTDRKNYNCSCPKPKQNMAFSNTLQSTSFNPEMLKNYFVSFTGSSSSNKSTHKSQMMERTNAAEYINEAGIQLAKELGHKEYGPWHVMYNAIADTIQYIDALGDGEYNEDYLDPEEAPMFFVSVHDKKIFENKDYRKKLRDVLENKLYEVADELDKIPQTKSKAKPKISKNLYRDILNIKLSEKEDDTPAMLDGIDFLNGSFVSTDKKIKVFYRDLRIKISDIYKLEDKKADKRLYFPNYDKQAENIMKNLNMGTSMFVTYDSDKVEPNYFVPSITKALERSTGKLTTDNTEIIEFNKNVNMGYFTDKVEQLSQNQDKNYIFVFSQTNLLSNSSTAVLPDGTRVALFSDEYLKALEKTPKNIKLVAVEKKEGYLSRMQNPQLANIYGNMGEVSIPVLNKDDVMKALLKNDKILKENNLNYTRKALEKVVETSAQMDGKFPEKTINLLKKISRYYVDKKEITPKDVDNYVKNSDYLFKQMNPDGSFEIVFDTGKRLNDIIGKSNTKKEAENIIRQIKSNKMGTKGFLIYSQDGSVGAGRRHTAEVIAGEAKIPFVAINTMDFGTKEVDLFGGSAMSPEASIKKLFSTVATQAETNPHKSAVLFIENFEYFSVGELVSEYHQKAMAQLIREMANAEKKGLNIAVIGSVSDPSLMGEATAKSSRFNDEIEVSSPAINFVERYEVLEHAAKHNKIKLAGTPDEQEKVLMRFAKFMAGASFLELKNFMQKAESIAQERGHKEITSADMTEGFMRMQTGRANMQPVPEFEKEIVTKHECGHATTITVLNQLMKSTNRPWTVPSAVNFISLDPRGYYGGVVYSDDDINTEYSFEKMFSEVVLSYGGHSAEKYFYDMDGSLGITSDLEHVTKKAMYMVKEFGQGHHTGRININELSGMLSNNVTDTVRSKVEKDIDVITNNALLVSDLIVEEYSDFINEFADRYSNRVGTGDCLIDGDDFRKEFEDWKAKQSPEKIAQLKALDNIILDIIKDSKKGKLY